MIELIRKYAGSEFLTASSTVSASLSSKEMDSEDDRFAMNKFSLIFKNRALEDSYIHSFYGNKILFRFAVSQFIAAVTIIQYIFTAADYRFPILWVNYIIISSLMLLSCIPCVLRSLVARIRFIRAYEVWFVFLIMYTLVIVIGREAYFLSSTGLFLIQIGLYTYVRIRFIALLYLSFFACFVNAFARFVFAVLLSPLLTPEAMGFSNPIRLCVFHVLCQFFQNGFILWGMYNLEVFHRLNFIQCKKISLNNIKLQREIQYMGLFLSNIVPPEMVREVRQNMTLDEGRGYIIKHHRGIAIHADFIGFSENCSNLPPATIIEYMNCYVTKFDVLAKEFSVTKVATAGDSFLAVITTESTPCREISSLNTRGVLFAIALVCAVRETGKPGWKIRVGISLGRLIFTVLCDVTYSFDVVGTAVSRSRKLETVCAPNCVRVAKEVLKRTEHLVQFTVDREGCCCLIDVETLGVDVIKEPMVRLYTKKLILRMEKRTHRVSYSNSNLSPDREEDGGAAGDDNKMYISQLPASVFEAAGGDVVVVKQSVTARVLSGLYRAVFQSRYIPVLSTFRKRETERKFKRRLLHVLLTHRHMFFILNILINLVAIVNIFGLGALQEYYLHSHVILYYCSISFSLLALFLQSCLNSVVPREWQGSIIVFDHITVLTVFAFNIACVLTIPKEWKWDYTHGEYGMALFVPLGSVYWYRSLLDLLIGAYANETINLSLKVLYAMLYELCLLIRVEIITRSQFLFFHLIDPTLGAVGAGLMMGLREYVMRRCYLKKNDAKVQCERIRKELGRNRDLILSVIPKSILMRMYTEKFIFDSIASAVLVFMKIEKFGTQIDEEELTKEYIKYVSENFLLFDRILRKEKVWKVKNIEKYYFCLCEGGDLTNMLNALRKIVRCFILSRRRSSFKSRYGLKIGLAEGNVCAGMLGFDKLRWDVLGKNVNLASRLCDTSTRENEIHVIEENLEEIVSTFSIPISFRCHETCQIKGFGDSVNCCYIHFSNDDFRGLYYSALSETDSQDSSSSSSDGSGSSRVSRSSSGIFSTVFSKSTFSRHSSMASLASLASNTSSSSFQ